MAAGRALVLTPSGGSNNVNAATVAVHLAGKVCGLAGKLRQRLTHAQCYYRPKSSFHVLINTA